MMNFFKLAALSLFAGGVSLGTFAQDDAAKPRIRVYEFSDQAVITQMSDNGKWAVANGVSSSNESQPNYPKLINLDNDTVYNLLDAYSGDDVASAGLRDVSDDGSVVVGTFNGYPAYWKRSTGHWEILPVEEGWKGGLVRSVTPDGKLAVGVQFSPDNEYECSPLMWDLAGDSIVPLSGLPQKDMAQEDKGQNELAAISADGRYLLGCMSYSYLPTVLDAGGCFYYVYDRTTATYDPIGFTETESGRWQPKQEGVFVIMDAAFNAAGNMVTGKVHIVNEVEESEFPDEYDATFLYEAQGGRFTAYTKSEDLGLIGCAVDNMGLLYSGTPSGNPVREMSLRKGDYWYTLAQLLKQRYNVNFESVTGYSNTGTAVAVSSDCRRMVALIDPYTSYLLELPVTFSEACDSVDLLGSYEAEPAAGASISRLKNVTLTFDNNIQLLGSNQSVLILDADGNRLYNSVGITVEGKTMSVRYRSGALEGGKEYTLYIPAGTIALAGDATMTNGDIRIPYKGRDSKPVAVKTIYPAEGTAFAKLDYSTNQVLLTFDTDVQLTDNARISLYRNDEPEPYCELYAMYAQNLVALYPATTQYLFSGSSYRIEVAAGTVTDVAGNDPNELITIHYEGTYERQISSDDRQLFSEDFNSGIDNVMLFDGDRLNPATTPTSWGFSSTLGWWLCSDDDNTADMAAVSHSMYTPAGTSDDWMVIPQLYLPDDKCLLNFASQSYHKSAKDTLKVYVWPSDKVYNTLTADIVAQIKEEGTLLYCSHQSPGEKEETLDGEWTQNSLSLAPFAGMSVYIAFLNDNTGQSAIFVDNIEVLHDIPYTFGLDYEASVVNRESAPITGRFTCRQSETTLYPSISLALKDADGLTIDSIHCTDLTLRAGQSHAFAFAKELPLAVGVINNFTVTMTVDDEPAAEYRGSVRNLVFQPVKRVVLEEYSGRACGNCPLGIVAIERLQQRYGSRFIPIALRTYGDDPLGSGLGSYTSFLGLSAAPSGVVNRSGIASYPASSNSDTDEYYFSAPEGGEKLWADYVEEEMTAEADADISATLAYDAASNTLTVPCTVRYALNADNQNVSLLMVLLEDNLLTYQANYYASVSNDALGEWGSGGKYGQSYVYPYYCMDVARASYGLTFNGTGGYLPQQMQAGVSYDVELKAALPASVADVSNVKMVVMMIDANTGRVINAVRTSLGESSGVDNVDADAPVAVAALHGALSVTLPGEAEVSLYAADGTLLGTKSGHGCITLSTGGYRGMAIVKAATANGVSVKKILVK